MLHVVRVSVKPDIISKQLLNDIERYLGIHSIYDIATVKVYYFCDVDTESLNRLVKTLIEPLNQQYSLNRPLVHDASRSIEIGYKSGVMNPEIASLHKMVQDLFLPAIPIIDSSHEYHFYGTPMDEEIKYIIHRLLMNETIEDVVEDKNILPSFVSFGPSVVFIPIRNLTDSELIDLSKNNMLFLSLDEMKEIQTYFIKEGREPRDAEIETIAQTWSEHCSHKTFKSSLSLQRMNKESLFSRLKKTALQYDTNIVSAFVDNAGAFKFYDGYALLAKAETHNSPSAIEPYGGASTGSGGVFRDIMGTGKGADVIASTDIFCFAPPTLSDEKVPPGCLHPRYLLRRVVAGVRDYGNRMGIPTLNGSVHFHNDFCAKPTVIVGAYGIAPIEDSIKRNPLVNDRIMLVGGRTGRDGIHGATFSSGSMTSKTISLNANAVQIGNPIEEKRMADALNAARDKKLIRTLTDCGAGGLSSAVGEMGAELGVYVSLENVPLKYEGLEPWEIWVSESQERMVCAIEPEKVDVFCQLCADYNVPVTNIGFFTGDQQLRVFYNDNVVCDIAMPFLHEGQPKKIIHAQQDEKRTISSSFYFVQQPTTSQEWKNIFNQMLSHVNICSKEPIVRQYDHMVQGANSLPPYGGMNGHGAQDAAVITPLLGKPYAAIIAHGVNPILNRLDPYYGSLWALVECIANVVSVGGNPHDIALLDNFIWPTPDEHFLWALDQAIEACIYGMNIFNIPFISGKDSLSSTYVYPDGNVLTIPPVLAISAIGKIPDVNKTVSSDIKKVGSQLVLVGSLDLNGMAGSVYYDVLGIDCVKQGRIPHVDCTAALSIFETIHKAIFKGIILSCHDISEGGLAVALAEMCFGNMIGASVDCTEIGECLDSILFNETAGCFIVEIPSHIDIEMVFKDVPFYYLGVTTDEHAIEIKHATQTVVSFSLEKLLIQWQRPMKEIFNS